MSQPLVTASRVDLFLECTCSALLPQTQEYGEAAVRGTEVHEAVLRPGRLPQAALDWFGGREPRYESTFAVEVLPAASSDQPGEWPFGRVAYLGQNLQRAYDLPDPVVIEGRGGAWVAGTADAPQVSGGVLSVADLKTGFGQCAGSLPHPARAGQLLSLAGMLRLWLESGGGREPGVRWTVPGEAQDAPRTRQEAAVGAGGGSGTPDSSAPALWLPGRVSEHRAQPSVDLAAAQRLPWALERVRLAWVLHPDDGPTRVEDAEVEPGHLDQWLRRLAGRVRQAQHGQPAMRPGHHCAHCPAFDACPAQGGALRRLAEVADQGGPLTVADAAAVVAAIPAAERQLASARRALRLYVERSAPTGSDLSIGGGRALRVVRGTRRDIDVWTAISSGVVGPQHARLTVTQASIRDADPGCDVDAVMARLEEVGAVSHVHTAPHVRVVRCEE